MNLLGTGAVALAVVSVLLGVLGGALLQGLVRGRGPGRFLARALVTLLASSLVCFGVAVELNHHEGWYTSTADLTGSDTGQQADAQAQAVRNGPAGSATGQQLPALPSPGQRVQSYRVTSADGSVTGGVVVVLPTGYQDAAAAHRRYPVLFLGHGIPGQPRQWLSSINIRHYLDPLVAARRIQDAVVVVPMLMSPEHTDTECVFTSRGADALESWLATDVPDFVLSHFRVRPRASAWAAMGFSAGGWCSALLALRHPDRFGAAISLGGYFRPLWDAAPPFDAASAQARRLDLVALAGNHPPAVQVFAQASDEDPESGPSTRAFARAATPPLRVTLVMDAHGGHRTSVWMAHVDDALLWLAHTLPGFAPQTS